MIRIGRGCHALPKLNTWNSIHLQPAGTHSGWHQRVTLSLTQSTAGRLSAQTGSVKTQTRTTKIWLLVRWHQNPKQSNYLKRSVLTAHWGLKTGLFILLYRGKKLDCTLYCIRIFPNRSPGDWGEIFWATSMDSLCHELHTHAYINVQSLRGSWVTLYINLCAHIHMHARTYTKGMWGDDEAVTGVPHLLSCERVPELALG